MEQHLTKTVDATIMNYIRVGLTAQIKRHLDKMGYVKVYLQELSQSTLKDIEDIEVEFVDDQRQCSDDSRGIDYIMLKNISLNFHLISRAAFQIDIDNVKRAVLRSKPSSGMESEQCIVFYNDIDAIDFDNHGFDGYTVVEAENPFSEKFSKRDLSNLFKMYKSLKSTVDYAKEQVETSEAYLEKFKNGLKPEERLALNAMLGETI